MPIRLLRKGHLKTSFKEILSIPMKLREYTSMLMNIQPKLLVRAADIAANKIYYLARNEMREEIRRLQNMHVIYLP